MKFFMIIALVAGSLVNPFWVIALLSAIITKQRDRIASDKRTCYGLPLRGLSETLWALIPIAFFWWLILLCHGFDMKVMLKITYWGCMVSAVIGYFYDVLCCKNRLRVNASKLIKAVDSIVSFTSSMCMIVIKAIKDIVVLSCSGCIAVCLAFSKFMSNKENKLMLMRLFAQPLLVSYWAGRYLDVLDAIPDDMAHPLNEQRAQISFAAETTLSVTWYIVIGGIGENFYQYTAFVLMLSLLALVAGIFSTISIKK